MALVLLLFFCLSVGWTAASPLAAAAPTANPDQDCVAQCVLTEDTGNDIHHRDDAEAEVEQECHLPVQAIRLLREVVACSVGDR